jgi:hypothetical protein
MSEDQSTVRHRPNRSTDSKDPHGNNTKSLPSQSFSSGYSHDLQDYPSTSLSGSLPEVGTKIFELERTGYLLNYRVLDNDKKPIYYVTNSTFTRGVPDVQISVGSEKGGPVIAAARFIKFSLASRMELALGDPASEITGGDVYWEEFYRERSWTLSTYKFSIMVNDQRRNFLWKRTHDSKHGVKGVEKISFFNYKLVEEGQEDKILAVYLNSALHGLSNQGKIMMHVNLGKDWQTWVLISALSLLEKNRRRVRRS